MKQTQQEAPLISGAYEEEREKVLLLHQYHFALGGEAVDVELIDIDT
jgi:hypothetical protein